MAAGLQCWDAAGNLVVDLPDRLTRIVGKATIPAGGTGYITDTALGTGSVWWAVLGGTSLIGAYAPRLTPEPANNRIKYEPNPGGLGPSDVTIVYGVY